MKKLDNYMRSLEILKHVDFAMADENEIYRTGVIGHFNLSFELAWKALQAVLRLHGVQAADSGSPREILQLGYRFGFLEDVAVWLQMLKQRNASIHMYDEEAADTLLLLIRDSFLPAFEKLKEVLLEKYKAAEG